VNEFEGSIQGVACFSAALSDGEVDELLECCSWTDISGDARSQVPIEMSRGLMDDRPDARVAPVGTCTFALNNAEDNEGSTRSWYSPGHANCRSGFVRGIPVRASLGTDGIGSTIQFIGTISEIKPTSGIYNERLTYCIAYDWMQEAAKFNLKGIETQENVTADGVLTLILMQMANKPHDLSFAVGTDTYPIALDNTNDENAFAQSEFSRLMLSEMGLLFVKGDGTLVFENRSTRSALTTVDHTFDNDMAEADTDASTDQIINRVRVTVHPREIDAAATTVLFTTSNRVAIDYGLTTKMFFQFRDPNQRSARFGGLDVVTPVSTTHYTLNESEDGSGVNATGNALINLTWEISGSGIYLDADNQYGQRVWMDLTVLGRGVYDFEPVTIIEENQDSINAVGVNEVAIDMPYQTLAPVGQAAALQILNTFQTLATRLLGIEFPMRKALKYINASTLSDISTRIQAMEEMSGVNGEFFINGIKHSYAQDRNIRTTFVLTPADSQDYWIMDVSALDTETRLGF